MTLGDGRIRHTVVLTPRHAAGSPEEADFPAAAENEHPDHVRFVQDRWLPEVDDFLEIDYAP
jgi:hypothetical protein